MEHVDLRVIDCPDRRLAHRAQSYILELVADGRTQVSVLIPRLLHKRAWHRILHDRTSDSLAVALSKLPNVSVTFVPFHLGAEGADALVLPPMAPVGQGPAVTADELGRVPMGALQWRQPAVVEGKVEQLVIESVGGAPSLIAVIDDGTGRVDLLFMGRAHLGGVELGAKLRATGTSGAHRGRMTMLNPVIEITVPAPALSHSPLEATHH